MANLIIYEKETGRITRSTTCADEDVEAQIMSHEAYIEGLMELGSEMYVKDEELLPRPENPAYLKDGTIYDIVVPSVLRINRESYDVDESTVELDLPDTRIYMELTSPFPYLKKVFV